MLELRILSGLHRGAAFPFDGETIRLGSSPDNDLVLCDPGMPRHAATFSRSVDGAWSFRASATGAAARPILVSAGTHLAVGPVSVGIVDEFAPWDAEPGLLNAEGNGEPRTMSRMLHPLIVELACVAAAAAILLAAAFLWTRFTPDARPSATATGDEKAAPHAAEPVEAFVYPPTTAIASAPLAVLSVRQGRHGFVVTREGQVLAPGYRWRDYTLQRIEPHRIVFSGTGMAEFAW